jgi:hypothetical protein
MSNTEKYCETKLSPVIYSVFNGIRDKLFLINERFLTSYSGAVWIVLDNKIK